MQYILSQEEYEEYMQLKKEKKSDRRVLSKVQQKVYDLLKDHQGDITYDKMAKILDRHPSAIYRTVCLLEKYGYITKSTNGEISIT